MLLRAMGGVCPRADGRSDLRAVVLQWIERGPRGSAGEGERGRKEVLE